MSKKIKLEQSVSVKNFNNEIISEKGFVSADVKMPSEKKFSEMNNLE